jgi:hypothetical protein
MQPDQTVATCSRGFSELSLAHAFKAQGVGLKYPSRSRSGIRWEDGVVVFALEEVDVRPSAGGFRCLLWSPVSERRALGADRAGLQERHEHARLAARRGSADGLLVKSGAVVDANAVLTLRVERRRGEYWASWSTSARVHGEAA